MQLQPVYKLKERLEAAAIAGIRLLGEDFRLKRALDTLTPLAATSPVLARIGAAIDKLLAAASTDAQSGLLLDALALVDAVCYTQSVTDLPGEWEPLPHIGTGTYCVVAYSQLHPLLDALTSTDSGRLAVIEQTWASNPAFFSDFRVLPWVVRALGDSYAKLAERIATILQSIGAIALPLLEEDFDPAGGVEMVRRVRVIEAIAASEAANGKTDAISQANAFYCAMLEDTAQAKGKVKQALIYALRHDVSNVERLLTLCQTERGADQKIAHHALAQLDTPETWAYWNALLAKKPQTTKKINDCIWYLVDAGSRAAGERINRLLLEQLAPLVANLYDPVEDSRRKTIALLLYALAHKPGETVADSVRQAAALAANAHTAAVADASIQASTQAGTNAADWGVPTDKLITYDYSGLYDNIPFHQALPLFLERALLIRPDATWLKLAMELYQTYGGAYLPVALVAQFLTQPGEVCYEWARAQLPPDEDWDKPEVQETIAVFRETCRCTLGTYKKFQWNHARQNYEFSFHYACAATGKPQSVTQPLAGPFDLRWYSLLIQLQDDQNSLDPLLYKLAESRLIRAHHDNDLWEAIGPYLCRRVLTSTITSRFDNVLFIYILKDMNGRHWKGVLRQQVERAGILDLRRVRYLLPTMTLSDSEKAAELRELDQLVASGWGKTLKYCHWDTREAQALIRELESSAYYNSFGILRQQVERTGILDWRRMRYLLPTMPLRNSEKAAELRELDQLVESGWGKRLKYFHWDHQEVQALIRELEASTYHNSFDL